MRTIFLLLIAFQSFGQTDKSELVEIVRHWPNRVDVDVTDGLIHRRLVSDTQDTAFYFKSNGKKFIATTTFKEIGGPIVIPPTNQVIEKVDGEKATFTSEWYHGTTNANWYLKTIAFSNVAGSSFTYTFTGTKIELWAETLPTHGTGTIILGGTSQTVTFKGEPKLPTLIYSSPVMSDGPHIIKLTVTSGYCLLDYFVISHPVGWIPPVIVPPVVVPPSQGSINVLPGQNLKSIIESAGAGKTVRIADAVFSSPIINVPKGVSIECGKSTVINCTTPGAQGGKEEGLFMFTSPSRVAGNQSISNCILEGNNVAFGAIIIDNVDNIRIQNVKIKNFNFTGAWIKRASNIIVRKCNFSNTAWSSAQFLSGSINLFNVSQFLCDSSYFSSNMNNKGTGIEALWKYPDNPNILTDVKIIRNTFLMSHQNPWGGQNFSIEFHNTDYRGIEIAYNDFGNELSMASHRPGGNGKVTWIHHNTGNLAGDNYFLEVIGDDFLVENNNIKGAKMFSNNTQPNSLWHNHTYRNNIFVSAGKVDWGGIFLFGKSGVTNVLIEGNTIKTAGNVLTKWMSGQQTGVTERNNNVTQ